MMEEKGKITTETKISKNPIISVDTSIGDMLKWDADGRMLDFSTSPEGFKTLTADVLKELSFENKSRYLMAKQLAELEAGGAEDAWKNDVVITEQFASPTERTTVKNAQDGYKYYLSTTAKIGKHEAEGYHVVPKGSPESIGLSGRNTIGNVGREELVLMRTTEENYNKLQAHKKQRNEHRKGAMEANVRNVGDENDIRTFNPNK